MGVRRQTGAMVPAAAMVAIACGGDATGREWTAAEAYEAGTAGEAVLVDVRTLSEWLETGLPEGALTVPEDHPGGYPGVREEIKALRTDHPGRKIVLICRTGNRTGRLLDDLQRAGVEGVGHVAGGVAGSARGRGWIAAGLPMERYRGPGRHTATLDTPARTLGAEDAPYRALTFSSVTCALCRRMELEQFPEIRRRWIETGQLRWEHYPIPMEQTSLLAAMVGHCAGAGAYDAVRHHLFQAFQSLAERPEGMPGHWLPVLYRAVEPLGWGHSDLRACVESERLMERVLAERVEVIERFGLRSLPTVIVFDRDGDEVRRFTGEEGADGVPGLLEFFHSRS